MNDDYKPQIFYIPQNVSDNGNVLWGWVRLRNLVEAIAIGIVMYLVWKILFFSFGLVAKTIAAAVLILFPVCAAVVGVKEESLIEWLLDFVFFFKRKRNMIFRIPRLEEPPKAKLPFKRQKVQEYMGEKPKPDAVGKPMAPEKKKKTKPSFSIGKPKKQGKRP